MDIQKAFTFEFEDEQWKNKVLLGAIISAVPILNFAASGYSLDLTKNVVEDSSTPLPTWDDLGRMFVRGLLWLVGILIYSIPPIIILCLFGAIGSGLGVATQDSESASNAIGALMGGTGLLLTCLVGLYSVAVVIILPAATVRFALSGQLSAMFKFNELLADIRANVTGYITVILVGLVSGFILTVALSIISFGLLLIPVCGWIASWILSLGATFYYQLAVSHLWGQFYRDAKTAGLVTV